MLILRRISNDGIQMNNIVGTGYTFVHRETNPEEFRRIYKEYFKTEHVADNDPTSTELSKNTYAFICHIDYVQALYKNQKAFMMTDSGKIFETFAYN